MKAKQILFAAVFTTMLAGAASAAGTTWMGLTGGAAIPAGSYADVANTGWNLGVTGTHWIDNTWGFGGEVAWHSWNGSDALNTAAESAFGPGSEFHWTALQATAQTTMNIPVQSAVKPYASMGVGMYNVTESLSSPSGDSDQSKSKLGLNFGTGMNFPGTGSMQWGLCARYHVIPASGDMGSNMNFFTVGVNMTMWHMTGGK